VDRVLLLERGVMTTSLIELRACVDVGDLERGVLFYTQGLGLRVGRRFGENWVELLGVSAPIDLLAKPVGSPAFAGPNAPLREYRRHWTPVHLDFVVPDLDVAVRRAQVAGATLDGEVRTLTWGLLANMADPFGNGFCLLEFRGRGYNELLEP
jgi:predicted enzyme related to lactoylglutathione lyase